MEKMQQTNFKYPLPQFANKQTLKRSIFERKCAQANLKLGIETLRSYVSRTPKVNKACQCKSHPKNLLENRQMSQGAENGDAKREKTPTSSSSPPRISLSSPATQKFNLLCHRNLAHMQPKSPFDFPNPQHRSAPQMPIPKRSLSCGQPQAGTRRRS